MYQVKLEKFEGPLELLLDLIEKEKLSITELNLAHVADQYLDYIKDNQSIHLENLADFLSVAAKLILIKSRALLPILKFSDEEEEEIEDLAQQLAEYKKFKEISAKVRKLALENRVCYSKPPYQGIKSVFYPPENINAFDLKKYFQKVLSEIPAVAVLQEELVSEIVTMEERISDLEIALRNKLETCFSELVSEAKDKIDVIISFLAMLEMVKQRMIHVEQKELFQDIKLSMRSGSE
ncbi:MAG: segregation/condensation protein A [Candidatus Moranbacteria bacterium]|nr:segregation/condensation protein A [Candidatus Moranbacteria bacterium]